MANICQRSGRKFSVIVNTIFGMDRRNFRKPVQPERKAEKREQLDLNKITEKAIINAMLNEANANVNDINKGSDSEWKVNADKLKKVELEPRKDTVVRKINVETPRGKNADVTVKVAGGDTPRKRLQNPKAPVKKVVEIQSVENPVNKIDTEITKNKVDIFNVRLSQQERGDSDRKTKYDRFKTPVTRNFDDILRNANNVVAQRHLDLDERRKIEENYTLRTKVQNGLLPANGVKKDIANNKREANNVYIGKPNLETSKIVPPKKPSGATKIAADPTPPSKESEKDSLPQKKPMIKTITSKNDATKIYKAVTFVERSKQKPTTIQVKLPDEYKSPKTSDTSAVIKNLSDDSKESIDYKEDILKSVAPKKVRFKKSKLKRLVKSPDPVIRENSPQTEVAKWAPSCINKHTKPYYEAWVSTTLAAISKTSKKDKLFLEKQRILESFQRALLTQRPETPDLVYENLNDERYTGRITVRQR